MGREIVIRYTIPTKFDMAPYGTICKVLLDNDKVEHFIQLGQSDVQWKRLGTFFEEAFDGFLHDRGFVDECLALFSKKTLDLFLDIKGISEDK